MKQTIYSLFLLVLFGMTGMQAWADDLTTTEINGVTYYEIKNGEDLVAFAQLVNGDSEVDPAIPGQYNANAILTADIDMTGITWEFPIGVITGEENKEIGSGAFTGIFDGQGHKITGFETEVAAPGHGGLFGDAKGATIKNFSIWGKLTALGGHGSGVIAYPENSTITGIHSYLEISVPDEVTGVCHVGGVVGSARGGNTISKCTFSGTMTVAVGNTDCYGGVVGYGGDSISFCANYGTITFDDQECAAGGVTGYVNNTNIYVQNCLNMGSLVYNYPEDAEEAQQTPKYGGAIVGRLRNHDLAKMKGNVWLEGTATGAGKDNDGRVNLTQASCVTAAQIASGEACYLLNGDQTEIGWYQTLGTDEQPVLDATHAQVYMIGHKHCNGDLYEGYTFNNEASGIIQDDHNMVNGVCDYCGLIDWDVIANSMVLNDDGFYEISNAPQLMLFEQYVNKGNLDANAILTADIDFAVLMPKGADTEKTEVAWTPIGDWGQIRGTASACYKGHFDGQGHTIKNFNVTSSCNYYGIFGVISEGSLIENFDIFGTLNLGHKTGGVVGYTRDTACTIRNIHSYLTLNVTEAATTAERPGGIVGSAVNGTTNIENCIYSGILNAGGHTGNIGGIVGYINNNSAAIVNITNCLFDGEIQNGTSADGQCGGIVGYNNGGKATIKNCLSIGIIVSSDGNIGQLIGRLNGSNTTFANNYYLGDFVNGTSSGKSAKGSAPVQVDTDQLESGEVCWELNEEKFLDSSWRQTLSEDETGDPYPLPTGEGDYVYEFSTGLDNITNDNIDEIIRDLITEENEFLDQIEYAYQALIDAYKAEIDSWEDIETVEAFFASYRGTLELKESINKSIAAYDAYIDVCENAISYVDENGLEGEWTDFLMAYLDQDIDPNSDYPNGSYSYILENLQLDDDALAEEKAFVEQMLANAIAGGLTAGTEITRLLINPNFADGFEGWTIENDESVEMKTGGVTSVMHIARGLGNGTFNVSQALTELPEGVYMMATNAMFRAASGDYNSKFYAGQLFMNNTVNYVMTAGEDVLAENATGMTQYEGDDAEGYVPSSMDGASYAFSAGHYLNFCATKVTDGNLTVGVRNLDNGQASQWLPFGNMHIYYLGTEEDAKEDLNEALQGYCDRTDRILNFEVSEDTNTPADYHKKPNISQVLKDALEMTYSKADTLLAGEELINGEDHLTLINTFSDLFNEVFTCRKAYIEMLDAANRLAELIGPALDAGFMSEDDFDMWDTEIQNAMQHFSDGDISTEEARAITELLNGCEYMMMPVDGVYQLETPIDMVMFSSLVNSGEYDAKAVLVNDIDMSEVMGTGNEEDDILNIFTPIGSGSNAIYTGTFDGQGHAITNFNYEAIGDWNGLFGYIENATIKNFRISGTLKSDGHNYNGVVGQAEGTSKVSGIYSDMTINLANFKAHSGGIVGGCTTSSKILVENCEFAGTLTHSGSGDCQAGILGYTYAGGVKNCVFSGTIIGESSKYGGILGYCKVPGFQGVQNCLSVGKIIANEGCTTAAAIIANWNGDVTTGVKNNYYRLQEGSTTDLAIGNKASSCEPPVEVTEKQLASGEVCYKLNGDQSVINWYQTINEDAYPVPFEGHEQVFFNQEEDFYYNLINGIPVGIKQIESSEPKVQVQFTGIYNLAGQRLEKLQKGINIVNGKKILVK